MWLSAVHIIIPLRASVLFSYSSLIKWQPVRECTAWAKTQYRSQLLDWHFAFKFGIFSISYHIDVFFRSHSCMTLEKSHEMHLGISCHACHFLFTAATVFMKVCRDMLDCAAGAFLTGQLWLALWIWQLPSYGYENQGKNAMYFGDIRFLFQFWHNAWAVFPASFQGIV